jgi:pimeloyl-ACP methyl ester carboxylesterase
MVAAMSRAADRAWGGGIIRIEVNGTQLEVAVQGAGETVALIQTALVADELLPLAEQAALRDNYRVILYHRRGYAGSGPVTAPGSIGRDAADCAALLAALEAKPAHVVGLSYSGAVALQLAVDAPECVQTLTLIEPPPVHVPSAGEFRTATNQLIHDYQALGPIAAHAFMTRVAGVDWRVATEHTVPGSAEQIERDTPTFFEIDLPALLAWRFTAEDAQRISRPVLHIGGDSSGPWFAEVRELIPAWLPQAEDVVLSGADHSLALTHPAEVAVALVDFLRRHPIGS